MGWERTANRSSFKSEHFELIAFADEAKWFATVIMHGWGRVAVDAPTLPGSTREEAEVAAVSAARELAAELSLAARKAMLP